MFLAQLNFNQTVAASFFSAAFTAILVGGVAAFVIKRYEVRASNNVKKQDLRHQTQTSLRETYARLLVAQRRSREASLQLAKRAAADTRRPADEDLEEKAQLAHDEFIEAYHRLNLDADEQMWLDVRGLRDVLDDMLRFGRQGGADGAAQCSQLAEIAKEARQNLERSFRLLLDHKPLQKRNPLGKYDKGEVQVPQAPPRNRFALRLPLQRKNEA
jgi:hypothetical protein